LSTPSSSSSLRYAAVYSSPPEGNMLRLAAAYALAITAHGQNSDPTSLASAGLDPATMCNGTTLNTTWDVLLLGLNAMRCGTSSQSNCLYDTDQNTGATTLKDPPMCTVSRACARRSVLSLARLLRPGWPVSPLELLHRQEATSNPLCRGL
jgi:hypothetical protein